MDVVKNFILVYNHASQELEETYSFEDNTLAATRKYGELEEKYRGHTEMDIVLVGSDSIETVKITHANYFTGQAQRRVDDLFKSLNLA